MWQEAYGKCLVGTDNYFGCGKSGHMLRDCPMTNTQGKERNQAQESGPNFDAPKKITSMLANLEMIKRVLPMLLPVCCKYFKLCLCIT